MLGLNIFLVIKKRKKIGSKNNFGFKIVVQKNFESKNFLVQTFVVFFWDTSLREVNKPNLNLNVLQKRNKPPEMKNSHFLPSLLVARMHFSRSQDSHFLQMGCTFLQMGCILTLLECSFLQLSTYLTPVLKRAQDEKK